MADTINLNEIADNEVEQKIQELNKKSDRTAEESQELSSLKEERQTRYQKRIDRLTWESKTNAERVKQLEEENEKLKFDRESKDKAIESETPVRVVTDTIKVGNKSFYTDEALDSMVASKQMTYSEAVKHQQSRLISEASEDAYNRIKNENKAEEDKRIRSEDAAKIVSEYPQFSKTLADGSPNPQFNPEDPLYKETSRIYANGYSVNPRGLSLAVEEAKKILGIVGGRVDMTDQHSVTRSRPSSHEPQRKSEEVKITAEEEESAIRMYTRGDSINPQTGRVYTEKEAIEKYKRAKARREAGRETK